ncbi:MAG: hypothetical protein Q9187_005404 [Circinaria calcarea]
MVSNSDDYMLVRGYQGSARSGYFPPCHIAPQLIPYRLNLQHFFWKDQLGYNLHPSIPTSNPEIKIADVGTGTGIWLLELARDLSSSAQLDGFDIDLSQSPPKEWLPKNVNMYKLDVFEELPDDLVGKYDVIHARLFLLIVQNNDPTPILKNFIRMLIAINATTGQKDARMHPTWVADLSKTFRESGLIDVIEHRKETELSHILLHNDVILLALDEMSYRALDRLGEGRGQALRESLGKADAECRRGVAINQDRVTVIARKQS